MALNPEEVSSIIKKELESYDTTLEMESVGTTLQVGDGIARIWGLRDVQMSELISFPGDVAGLVLNLEADNVGAAIFGSDTQIKEGDPVKRTGKVAQVPVGDALLGRVVNPLGEPLDGEFDIAIARALFQVLSDENCRKAARNIAAALPVGGTFFIIGRICDDTRLSPVNVVGQNLAFLTQFDDGEAHTESRYQDWLEHA